MKRTREKTPGRFGLMPTDRCLSFSLALNLDLRPLPLSNLPSPGHRRRLGPRNLRDNARGRRSGGRFPCQRNRHRPPAPGRGDNLLGLCEAGCDGEAAECGTGSGVGPADGGFVGFPARVLRVEDRVLRVEEEGRILVR